MDKFKERKKERNLNASIESLNCYMIVYDRESVGRLHNYEKHTGHQTA